MKSLFISNLYEVYMNRRYIIFFAIFVSASSLFSFSSAAISQQNMRDNRTINDLREEFVYGCSQFASNDASGEKCHCMFGKMLQTIPVDDLRNMLGATTNDLAMQYEDQLNEMARQCNLNLEL